MALHASPMTEWVDDSLPDLAAVRARGEELELIMLSAVWMHLDVFDFCSQNTLNSTADYAPIRSLLELAPRTARQPGNRPIRARNARPFGLTKCLHGVDG
jgi:hypothetical protein